MLHAGVRGPVWVFDLDDTLHDASRHVFPAINRMMTGYIERHLGVDTATADRLRVDYWHRYGATLVGLQRHHAVCPRHFLAHTHAFDDLAALLVAEPGLRHALQRLPGRRLLLTNAPRHYADAVLRHLGLQRLFDAVLGIEHSRFRPKPDPSGLRRLLRQLRVAPQRCVLVEDSLPNLLTARRLGLRTVWIAGTLRRSPAVDVRLQSVCRLPRALHRLHRGSPTHSLQGA